MISSHDMIVLGWVLFIAGFLMGVQAMFYWQTLRTESKELKHEETTIEQGKEIARLRAQVASLIGKE